MTAGKSLKASDKQAILKKVVTELKKRYGGSIPKHSRTTFETLLFAAILEDVPEKEAEAAYARLIDGFFDLNEIRVSSITEIERALGGIADSDWKAMRIREALQYTFEKYYSYDLETLRRKTQEQAQKELDSIPHQTPFIRQYTNQHSLGCHILPIDSTMNRTLIWMGLAPPEGAAEATAEDLKSAVKKAEAPLLCHLLKCLATDPELRDHFAHFNAAAEAPDPHLAGKRLADLFKNPGKFKPGKAKVNAKSPAKVISKKKPTPKKETSERKTGSAKGKKTAKPAPAKKVTRKKPVPKKTARSKSR